MKSSLTIAGVLIVVIGCGVKASNEATYTTCATDYACGITTYLHLGPELLEWSNGPENDGWLYFTDPYAVDNVGVWEFAPTQVKDFSDIDPTLLFSAEYCGKESSVGGELFSEDWNGGTIRVRQNEIIFARRTDKPDVAYALRFGKKDEDWRVWVTYRVSKKLPDSQPQWQALVNAPIEDEHNVLGTDLKLSPQEAKTALMDMMKTKGFISDNADRRIDSHLSRQEPVTIRRGIIVIGRVFRCDLQKGTFWFELGSPGGPYLQSHRGEFRSENGTWRAVIVRSDFLHRPHHK